MNNLKKKKLWLFDMDGTIYLDNDLFDGTLDLLHYIKGNGGRYIFLTNNSSKSVSAYVEKLNKLGIQAEERDFFTSTDATAIYLKSKAYTKIYALGTASFRGQLSEAGFPVTDKLEDDIDCLCMGFDTELTFKKLEEACILLNRGVDYIATNPDWVCPTWYGYVPDCGSISQILFNAVKRKPKFIGKPQPEMAEMAIAKSGYSKSEAILLGDRLYTDIACGVNAGISTVFVLSGEGTMEDLEKSESKPTYVMSGVREIYNKLVSV